jgi:hypothetical protein
MPSKCRGVKSCTLASRYAPNDPFNLLKAFQGFGDEMGGVLSNFSPEGKGEGVRPFGFPFRPSVPKDIGEMDAERQR